MPGASVTIIRGSLAAFLQRETYKYDPLRGFTHTFSFKGASQANMLALFNAYTTQGIACDLTYEHDIALLDVDDQTQQYTLDNWQLLGNEESRDGLSHPALLAICSAEQIAELRTGIENAALPASTNTVDQIIAKILAGGSLASITDAGQKTVLTAFLGLQFRGSTDYRKGQYVLRHTTNAPNNFVQNVANTGVDTIYTTAQLLAECQNSSFWINPIPAGISNSIGFIDTEQRPATQPDYLWGWLKSTSTYNTAANNRIEITTEFTLEQWSILPNGYYAVKTS